MTLHAILHLSPAQAERRQQRLRLELAEMGVRNPHLCTDAQLAEDCAIVLRDSSDPMLRDAAHRMQLALAVSPPFIPQAPHDPQTPEQAAILSLLDRVEALETTICTPGAVE